MGEGGAFNKSESRSAQRISDAFLLFITVGTPLDSRWEKLGGKSG